MKKIALVVGLALASNANIQAVGEIPYLAYMVALGVADEKLVHHASTPVALAGFGALNALSRFVVFPVLTSFRMDGKSVRPIDERVVTFGFLMCTAAALTAYYFEKDKSPDHKTKSIKEIAE